MTDRTLLDELRAGAASHRASMLVASLLTLSVGAALLVAPLTGVDPSLTHGGKLASLFLGVALLAVACWMARASTRGDSLVRCLEHQPERIVWVYDQPLYRRDDLTISGVMICTRDGARYSVLRDEETAVAIMARLRGSLPRAHFGYTEERHQSFRADPLSLALVPDPLEAG